jgi:hypothetical protein
MLGSPDIDLASSVVDKVESKTGAYDPPPTLKRFQELMIPNDDVMIIIPLVIIRMFREHLHASMHPAHGGTWEWRYTMHWGQ